MELNDLVSKSDFAKRCNVTAARVSQWIKAGQIGTEAIAGTGPRAKIRADVALQMLRGRVDWSHGASSAALGDDTSKFHAEAAAQKLRASVARTRSSDVLREINEIKLARLQRELAPIGAMRGAMETTWRAIQRAHMAAASWSEELTGAYQMGGLGAHAALLRVKMMELLNSSADMMTASVDKFESEEGATNA